MLEKKKIFIFSTPFDFESADFLEKLGVGAYKIASADLVNLPLIEHVAKKNKPMILSTGMADMKMVQAAYYKDPLITLNYLKKPFLDICLSKVALF